MLPVPWNKTKKSMAFYNILYSSLCYTAVCVQFGQWTWLATLQKWTFDAVYSGSLFWRVTLTCTHSFFVPRLVWAVVAVQSFVVVTRVCLVAHLAHLPGAGLAAVAAIHEKAYTWRALRGGLWTLAGPLAVLCAVVRVYKWGCDGCGRRHGGGIQGVGLQRGKGKENEISSSYTLYFIHLICPIAFTSCVQLMSHHQARAFVTVIAQKRSSAATLSTCLSGIFLLHERYLTPCVEAIFLMPLILIFFFIQPSLVTMSQQVMDLKGLKSLTCTLLLQC